MMESRVFAIKLFGRMISLHPNGGGEEEKNLQTSEITSEHKDQDQEILFASLESSKEEDTSIQENSVHEEQSKSTGNSGEKARKKPGDLLPCPRCKSTNTKFCYYNNYNISQPRHFCKNCQRYWTAGGSMRNVPVGAGRRKSKISASHCRRITMSIRPDDVLLRFDSDESTQKISEQTTTKNCHMELNSEEEAKSIKNCQGIPAVPLSLPCLDGNSWAYPWSPTPAICAPSFAIPLYPAAAYNAYWSIPWPSPLADKPKNGLSGSGTNSPTLGKHPRDGNMNNDDNPIKGGYLKETAKRNCMRIDDPDEAAKSSICAIVDVKNNKGDAVSRQSLFTAFQPKVDGRNQATENCHLLHSNPVALLRSLTFHEAS